MTDGTALRVRLVPSAARDVIEGFDESGALLVRVTAPPVEGRANERLPALLAARLGLPKSEITLRAGARSRQKTVLVPRLDAAAVRARLDAGR